MRKLITSSIFILLMGLGASAAYAGQYEVCDPFKKTKLYGTCNAYQNAYEQGDIDTMADLYANWLKKAGPDDILPNSPDDVVDTVCPCWANGELEYAVNPFDYEITDFGASVFVGAFFEGLNIGYTTETGPQDGFLNYCYFYNSTVDPVQETESINMPDDQGAVCAEDVLNLIETHWPSSP
jgi:hypothetical protein